MYTQPLFNFTTRFAWEYPDEQVPLCILDLKSYDMYVFNTLYKKTIFLPEDVASEDIVYVDMSI
jgi:hypothetical protein